jgi:hypothetical protein
MLGVLARHVGLAALTRSTNVRRWSADAAVAIATSDTTPSHITQPTTGRLFLLIILRSWKRTGRMVLAWPIHPHSAMSRAEMPKAKAQCFDA